MAMLWFWLDKHNSKTALRLPVKLQLHRAVVQP
jgi:hypothetical protein